MTVLQLLSVLFAAAALFGWLTVRFLRLPLTIGTVLLTVGAALGLEAISNFVPGLHSAALHVARQIDFEGLILHGMLSLLLFAGGFLLDLEDLIAERLVVGVLSVAGTVLTAALVTVLMHVVLAWAGVRSGWLPCMFFGALIAPTDPIAVLEMLRRVGAPRNLQAQLAGESLFNDGVGAVLFVTVLAVSRGAMPTMGSVFALLLLEVGGALALGILAAWLCSLLMRKVDSYQVEILLTLALALGGYALAERLNVSAPLEAVVAAIALRWFNRGLPEKAIARERIERFWESLDEVQNSILFVLLGLEVLAIPFPARYVASGLLAIGISLAVRLTVLTVLLRSVRLFSKHCSSVWVLGWGGLHGGLSLALALTVPHSAETAWILPTTYAVVVFTVVVQGTSMQALLRASAKTRAAEFAAR